MSEGSPELVGRELIEQGSGQEEGSKLLDGLGEASRSVLVGAGKSGQEGVVVT